MQDSVGIGEMVEVTVVRANKGILPVIVEVIKKNWILILIVLIVIYFLFKNKKKGQSPIKQWDWDREV